MSRLSDWARFQAKRKEWNALEAAEAKTAGYGFQRRLIPQIVEWLLATGKLK